MSIEGTEGYWKNKYITELAEWGVTVDPAAPYDEVKKMHAQEKKTRKVSPPDVPHLNLGSQPFTQEQLNEAVAAFMRSKEAEAPKEQQYQQQSWMTPEQMKELLMSVKEGTTNSKGQLRPGYIPPDDRIPTQKFFAPYVRYYVPEKYNGAHIEALPLNMDEMLKFTPSFGYTVKTGDMMGRKFVSILDVSSNAVYRWITGTDFHTGEKVAEPHPDFGRMFYKSVNRAIDATDNSMWSQIFKRHEQHLSTRKHHELMTLATQYNIPTTHEWGNEQYRAAIAEKMADIEFGGLKSKMDDNMRQRAAEAMLLRQEGHNVAMPA